MVRISSVLLIICLAIGVLFAQGMGNYDIYKGSRKVGSSEFELVKVGNHLQLKSTTTIEEAGKKTDYIEEGLFNSKMHPQSYKLNIKEPASLMMINAEFLGDKVEISGSAGVQESKKSLEFDSKGYVLLDKSPADIWMILKNYDFNFLGVARVPVLMVMKQETGELVLNKKGEEKIDGARHFKLEGQAGDKKINISVRKEDGIPVIIEYPGQNIEMRLIEKPSWAKDDNNKKSSSNSSPSSEYSPISPATIQSDEMLKMLRDYEELSFDFALDADDFLDRVYLNNRMQEFLGTMDEGGSLSGTIEVEEKKYRVTGAPDWPPVYPLQIDEEYKMPAPGIDSDDPDIKKRAEKAIAPTRSMWDAVRAINLWVYLNIEYTNDSYTSKEAFVNQKGDSRSKALLVAALCRSVEIPARLVGGMLYDGTQFKDHFWTEVFLGQGIGWAPVDPTLNDVDDISAAHVSLYVGTKDIPINASKVTVQNIKAKD
ncbi:MAG: transglutaminase-like domain-containing protein [Candidatus Zixiibacteriota bacterium]